MSIGERKNIRSFHFQNRSVVFPPLRRREQFFRLSPLRLNVTGCAPSSYAKIHVLRKGIVSNRFEIIAAATKTDILFLFFSRDNITVTFLLFRAKLVFRPGDDPFRHVAGLARDVVVAGDGVLVRVRGFFVHQFLIFATTATEPD